MRLFFGILAMCALAAGSAAAQSPLISKWTEDSYSEEGEGKYWTKTSEKWFNDGSVKGNKNNKIDFISGVLCSGDYCDNKNFKTISGIPAFPRIAVPGKGEELVDASIRGVDVNCPPDMYIYSMSCEGDYCSAVQAQCAKPILPEGVKAVCGFEKKISDEGASRNENEVTLASYQLFNGYKCEGDDCDDLTMRWCNIYGGEKDHLALALKGARWQFKGFMLGGERQTSYSAGLQSETGSSDTVNASVEVSASATISAEGSVGFGTVSAAATAGIAITAGYAREWNRSKASSSQVTVAVQCDKFEDGGTRADIYAFTLETESELLDAGAQLDAVSQYYACSYGKGDNPMPACLPTQCDNRFATNCQKCDGLHLTATFADAEKEVDEVQPQYRTEKEVRGSFVEFYGRWTWADKSHRPARTSYLVLYNDLERQKKYTFCKNKECVLMDGDYTKLSNGAELVLTGVFGEKDSEIVFTSDQSGTITGAYWREGAGVGEPDGTIELEQL